MRPYVRPLVVTFSALALATLFSYLAVTLTEPADKAVPEATAETLEKDQEAKQRMLFEEIRAKAAGGDVEAMLDLGLAYSVGMGTPIDRVATVKWVRQSAEHGNERAQYVYGQIFQRGQFAPKDSKEAIRWFRLSAAQGNADAELSLAQAYESGEGVEKNEEACLRWLKIAAQHGHPIAQADYGMKLYDPEKPGCWEESADWIRKSAMQGNPEAMFNLGVLYLRGQGAPKDRLIAMACFMVAELDADETIRSQIQELLGKASEADRRKAIKLCRGIIDKMEISTIYSQGSRSIELANRFHQQFQRAQLGKAEDQLELARLYHEGIGTVKDPFEAAVWCRQAAEQGNVNAMRTLAICLEDGDGVSVDLAEMAKWYRKAADQGDPESQFKLGVCYRDGLGVAKDDHHAVKWTKQSAEQGHPIAQANLGSFIISGDDQSRYPEAIKWFKLSAKQGHPGGMYKYAMALLGGIGVDEDRIEGAAWLIACQSRTREERLLKDIKTYVNKLTPAERDKAEAAATEIQKTL
jgi:TPR repeat protein